VEFLAQGVADAAEGSGDDDGGRHYLESGKRKAEN